MLFMTPGDRPRLKATQHTTPSCRCFGRAGRVGHLLSPRSKALHQLPGARIVLPDAQVGIGEEDRGVRRLGCSRVALKNTHTRL